RVYDELAVGAGRVQAAGVRDHRLGGVDADDRLKVICERARDAADAAPEIEQAMAPARGCDPIEAGDEPRRVGASGRQELVESPVRQLAGRAGQDRAVRILLSERVPVLAESIARPGHRPLAQRIAFAIWFRNRPSFHVSGKWPSAL